LAILKTILSSVQSPQELKGWRYRQIVEPPCRIFYREDAGRVLILHVMRSKRLLSPELLSDREQGGGET
jgi:hypothetical protein